MSPPRAFSDAPLLPAPAVGAKEEEEVSDPTTKDARPRARLNMTTEDYLDELCRRQRARHHKNGKFWPLSFDILNGSDASGLNR